MSNTIYCICVDCKRFESLKDGEEDMFKDDHYGHEIIIIVPLYLEVTHYDPENKAFNEISKTAFAQGAALFFKREIIENVGLLDDIFFIYAEETDWNLRAKKKGYEIYYVPTTIVYHKVTRNIKKKSLFRDYFFNRNTQILMWKHSKFKYLFPFYLKYLANNLRYLLSKIRDRDIKSINCQYNSIIQGFRIGVKRRTNQSCKKDLINNYNFINKHVLKSYRQK